MGVPPPVAEASRGADEIRVRRSRRKGLEHHFRRIRNDRGRRSPSRSEEDDLALGRQLIHPVQRPPLPGSMPRAERCEALHVQRARRVEAERRTVRRRPVLDRPVLDVDPVQVAVRRVVEVPIDPRNRRCRGDIRLELRHGLMGPDDASTPEHRLDRVIADGRRSCDHVHGNRPVRREVDLLLEGDVRHQDRRRLGRRRAANSRRPAV